MTSKCPTPTKQKWPTKGSAFSIALKQSGKSGKPMAVYRCRCGSYHLTSKTPKWSSTRDRH